MMKIDPEGNELLDVVDENDNVIGKATRNECHEKGLLHRISVTIVFDTDYRIFVGKRSKTKYYSPGKWGIYVGGHVESGESYEEAMGREIEEEIGIVEKITPVDKYVDMAEYDKECRKIFYIITNQKIKLNKNEYEDGIFLTYDELKQKMKQEKFIPKSDRDFRILTNLLKQKGIVK